tara:strand:+ start:20 stop:373 length:354 start_codon:yes stop_codon:yes gene_type:complete
MSSFQYTVGLNNVGSYQVAGSPYLTASSLTDEQKIISFPRVTQNIIIHNTGSQDLHFYFVSSPGVKLVLPQDKKMSMDIKCKELYVSASTGTGFQLCAELTNIPAARMFSLNGLEGV